MAISGVVDADIVTIANTLGVSRKQLATALGYTYQAPTLTFTDAGTHHGHLVIANMFGILTVDWGDGTVQRLDASSAGALTPTDHLYATNGSKTVKVQGLGTYKTATVSLA